MENVQVLKINNNTDLDQSLKIREEVFIKEQNVDISLEIDELDIIDDAKVYHFLLKYNENSIGTLRIVNCKDYLKIGRFAILKQYRNKGLGKYFLEQVMDYATVGNVFQKDNKYFYLEAQVHAIPFYEKLGFIEYGDEFLDANIKHKKMNRK